MTDTGKRIKVILIVGSTGRYRASLAAALLSVAGRTAKQTAYRGASIEALTDPLEVARQNALDLAGSFGGGALRAEELALTMRTACQRYPKRVESWQGQGKKRKPRIK